MAALQVKLVADTKQYLAGLAAAQKSSLAFSGKMKAVTGGVVALGAAAGATGIALFKVGEEFDQAYDKIKTQTGATGKEFKRLKNDTKAVFKSMPVDLDAAASAVAGLNQRLDVTGRPLRELSRQMVALSKITETDVNDNVRSSTRLLGDWSVATAKQSDTLDQLFRLSQKTGIEFGELSDLMVQFGSPLRTLGLDFEFSAAMLANFEKEGVNISTLMSGLRLSVANLSDPTDELAQSFKEFGITAKEPAEAVMQVMEAIKRTASVTKGNTLAFEVFGRRAGSDMAAAIREGRFELDDLLKTMTQGKSTIEGTERGTRDLSEHLQIFGNRIKTFVEPVATGFFKFLSRAAADLNKILRSEDFKQFADDLGAIFQVLGEILKPVFKILGASMKRTITLVKFLVHAYRSAVDPILGVFTTILDGMAAMADAMSHLPGPVGDAWDKIQTAAEDASDSLNKVREDIRDDNEKISRSHKKSARDISRSQDEVRASLARTNRAHEAHTGSANNMVNAVGSGYKRLGENTNRALKAFGAKPVNFAIVGGKEVGTSGLQRGGAIPGSGSGDRVPVMAEPGEGFINKRAVKAMGGPRAIDAINSAVPRFQAGGMVGLNPGISRLAKWAGDRYGLRISSGVRPGTGSLHNIGAAVDLVPPSMSATQGIFGAFKSQLAELFYDPWGGFNDGQMIGAIGGHMDHIHAAILGAGGPVAQARKLKRLMLKGPAGPLRNMGQSGLDKVRGAANKFISRHAMTTHGNIGNVSGPLQAIAQRMIASRWGMGQWPFFNDLVMRESGWDPTAVNPSSGAAGLAQALPPSKYPAGAWPYTGKSSAIKQLEWMMSYISGRYGTPAGAIDWHNAHNWYGKGADFIARKPQLIGVGDGGPERVSVTPLGGAGAPHVEVNIYGSGVTARDVEVLVDGRMAAFADYTLNEGGRGRSRGRQLRGR